ncbi:uncharacterized protein LOC119463813 [Dermacentor silvarum]|uniref:uncharacterized protein LOC119463813 n=1 Tax=Dermacentor silvarum TaxID=543639 RepID=UPI002101AC7B|nr:uncharacterized protein LOC119463813 [Dermacentor silvarum]
MAPVNCWILALAVACALFQGCVQGQFLRRFRSCVLPHERRARLWERNEQYCSAGRHLEYRRRSQRCICQPGYYRDEETNNCYDARRCGQCDSSKHERFSSCTNDCESVCGKPVIQQCDKPCVPGCECMKGYIRKYKKGPCVPIQACPPKCPAYMTFEMNRERCPRVCNVAREDSCSETNEGPGCACKKGFVLRAPFGTVRTRVWCIHESMCTFPDEDKGSDAKAEVKGVQSVKGKGGAANSFWGSNQGQHGWEESGPKKIDDLFPGGKGFPPLGDLGHKEAQGLQMDQQKVHLSGGQNAQAKVPGSDNIWGWNKGQPGVEGSVAQQIDDDLYQDTKGFPPIGGLGKKKGQVENLGQEEIGVKGGQENLGTGIIGNGNFWGWNKGQHKMDEDLYLDVNRFSNLGNLRQTAGKGSQFSQHEVSFNGGQSDHERHVSGSGHFWSLNKNQHGLEDSASKQPDNDLYQGAKGFPSVGQFGLKNGEASVFNPDEIGFKGGQSGQKGGALGSDNISGSNRGEHGFQESILKQNDNNLYLGAKGFPALGNLGYKNGPTSALNPDETLEGGQGIEAEGASASDNTWGLNKGQAGLKQSAPEESNNLFLGTKEFPSLGDLGHTKGQGSQLLQDLFLGGKHEGTSGQRNKIHDGQELLGLGALPDEKGQNIDMDDWLSGQQGTDAIPDLNKGQEGDEGLMSSKVVENWVPDEGQLQKGGSKKGGLPSSIKGASNIPGVGLPVGKLPNIGKLGGNGFPGGIPGVGTPVGELPNIGGASAKGMPFGGHLISQTVSNDNSPGQIEILSHGVKGAKGGPLHGGIGQKTGSVDWAQQNEAFSSHPEFPKATVSVPLSASTSSFLNQQSQNTHFIGQGWQTRHTNTAQPDAVDWPKQNEPSPRLPELQRATASFPFSGATVTSTNQRAESTSLPDFTGQGWQAGRANIAQPGTVDWMQQREPLSGISQFQRATTPVPLSGATFDSLNQQNEGMGSTGQGAQMLRSKMAQPTAVDWTQQREPFSGISQFQRATAPVLLSGATFGSLNQQKESMDSTNQGTQRRRGNMAQPSAVDWTQQREPLSGISQFQRATAPVLLSGTTFGSLNQQKESMDSKSQSAQIRQSSLAQPSAVDWKQQNQPLSMLPAFQASVASVPLAGATVASINQKKESTDFTGQRLQTRQVSVAQPGMFDWTPQNGALSTHPEFQRQTASVTFSGPNFGSPNQQKQSTDFTDQRSAPFSATTFGSLNQQSTHFQGHVSQTPDASIVQPEVVNWTPQNEQLSRFPEFQTATASVPRSGATVTSIAHKNRNTDFTSQVLQTRHISITQPGRIEWVHQNEPLSSIPELQRETTSVPLSSVTVASKNNQNQNTDLTGQASQTHHGSMTEPGAVNSTKQNEPLSRLPRATVSVLNSSATVPPKNQQKEKTDSTGVGSQNHHGHMTENRTQQNKPPSHLPELQKAKTSAALSGSIVASKDHPKNLTGPDLKTRHGSMKQTGTGSIKTGESTAGVVTNRKRNTGYTIFPSGMQLGRNIFGGQPNMFSAGSLFQYSWPVVGTGQLSAGNYPSGYGVYDALGQPFYGHSVIPIGYPMFYPSSYAPMTNIWGQRMGTVDDLPAQQRRAMESESPSSPTSLADQNAQQGQIQVARGGGKGGGVTGVKHKMPVGNVPAEENYAFDDRSLDSWYHVAGWSP